MNEQLSSMIYRLNKLLRQQMQNELRGFGITVDQWIALRQVYLKSGNLNQKDLAVACFKERAAITRMIDLMEKKDLIERGVSKQDRREYLLYITDKGSNLYKETESLIIKSHNVFSDVLTESEISSVLNGLLKLEKELTKKNT